MGSEMCIRDRCLDKSKIKPFLMPVQRHEDYITWLNVLKENEVEAYGLQSDLGRYRISSRDSISACTSLAVNSVWTADR